MTVAVAPPPAVRGGALGRRSPQTSRAREDALSDLESSRCLGRADASSASQRVKVQQAGLDPDTPGRSHWAASEIIIVVARRRDWDRARWDHLRSERGVEPQGIPASPATPRRKPAPRPEQLANIKRWQEELADLSYEEQLAYLAVLRRRLRRLFASDDRAAQVIAKKFKPILKIPGSKAAAKAASNEASAKTATYNVRRVPHPPRDKAIEEEIEQLVASRPGEMSQKTCSQVLTGSSSAKLDAAGLNQAEQYGSLAHHTAAAVSGHIVAAIGRGDITRRIDGMLQPR